MKMRKYKCVLCDFIYDEAKGDPESGLSPGTRFEDIPEDWSCPECGVTKTFLELMEVHRQRE
jgi:rubredoxin-NAD+ reductase